MKFTNILRILPGSRSCETIIISVYFLLLNFLWHLITRTSLLLLLLIFFKSIFRFYFDDLLVIGVHFGIDDNDNNLLPYPFFLPR